MKEDLLNLDGSPLFPARFAETRPVALSVDEDEIYRAVMDYADRWYEGSILALSIYGKRAASSLVAALLTLRRRAERLVAHQQGHVVPVAPHGFERPDFFGADLASEEDWESTERAVVMGRSIGRRAELTEVEKLISQLETTIKRYEAPSKWVCCRKSTLFARWPTQRE